MKTSEKCVLILSGGLDSSTVAYWVKEQSYQIYGLSFRYGQLASKEVECANLIASKLKIPLKTLSLASLREIFVGVTSLCDDSIEMTSTFSPSIIVPFRNAIFLSIAVAYAVSIGVGKIFYGAQGSDEAFYPDCRRVFFKSFEKAAQLGTGEKIIIEAPFSGIPKSEIIKIGFHLGVPYHLTWSCYFNRAKHCGRCESCINRQNAFQQARIPDPTEYIERDV